MHAEIPAWYCARTKPKHEHIAAINLRKYLRLKAFNPRLRVQQITQQGIAHLVEPLFPCHIFLHCVIEDRLNEVQHITGMGSLVRFGEKISKVQDSVIEELQHYFAAEETMTIEDRLVADDAVIIAEGNFCRNAGKSFADYASLATGANPARRPGSGRLGRGEPGFNSFGKEHGCQAGAGFSGILSEDAYLG